MATSRFGPPSRVLEAVQNLAELPRAPSANVGNDRAALGTTPFAAMPDLEQLAHKGRKKPRTPKPQRCENTPKSPTADERGRTKRALVHATGLAEAIPFLIVLVCGGVGAGVGRLVAPTEAGLALGAAAGGIVGFAVAFGGYWTLMFRREVRWLRTRPFRLDVEAYLRALGKDRKSETTKVVLRVRFEDALPDDAHGLVRDAGSGMHPKTDAKLSDGELVLQARIRTYYDKPLTSDVDGDRYPTHEVHDYVRHLFDKGLPALHSRYPLREVIVKMS